MALRQHRREYVRVTVEGEDPEEFTVGEMIDANEDDDEVMDALEGALAGQSCWVGGGAGESVFIEPSRRAKGRRRRKNGSLRGAALYVNPR